MTRARYWLFALLVAMLLSVVTIVAAVIAGPR